MKKQKIIANCQYDKKTSKEFPNTKYWKSSALEVKKIGYIENEEVRLKTEKIKTVTKRIKHVLRNNNFTKTGKVFIILEKIKDKNQRFAFRKKGKQEKEPINSNLLNLLADVSLLTVAYYRVRKNFGAMMEAHQISNLEYSRLSVKQKSWVNKTSELIKKNEYLWGIRRRIYLDIPEKKDAKRSKTIPSFMDKVVQEALTMILMSIYEPYFEAQNCSFGFRPDKGVHNAIIALTNSNTSGFNFALRGDMKNVYNRVDRNKLIEILGKKIKDKQFLEFIEKRLNYDRDKSKYVRLSEGLPQEGIDSPYLWNIYMSEFDVYITDFLTKELARVNEKRRGKLVKVKNMISNREKRKIDKKIRILRKIRDLVKTASKGKENYLTIETLKSLKNKNAKSLVKEILKELNMENIKDIRLLVAKIHLMEKNLKKLRYKLFSSDFNSIKWKFSYIRYADAWLILTNVKRYFLEITKEKISTYLRETLLATLSLEKMLIVDMQEASAHFLGYEISMYKEKKIKGKALLITAESRIFAMSNRQRLVDKLHMRGYCDSKGFPKEIGFLSNLEDFLIIEKYNSVLLGLAMYYCEFVKNPKKILARWFYIIRYSCLKTLSQKHKSNIRDIFKRYYTKISRDFRCKENTVTIEVKNITDGEKYKKKWTLYTSGALIEKVLFLKRKIRLSNIYWLLQKGEPIIYELKENERTANDNFYEI